MIGVTAIRSGEDEIGEVGSGIIGTLRDLLGAAGTLHAFRGPVRDYSPAYLTQLAIGNEEILPAATTCGFKFPGDRRRATESLARFKVSEVVFIFAQIDCTSS
jgi:hypothetical protein